MLKIIIAINPTDIIKYKISVIYKKLENHYLILICLFTPFIVQNSKKIFNSRFRVLRAQHIWAHPFTLNKIFFAKISNINFICLLVAFTVQNF